MINIQQNIGCSICCGKGCCTAVTATPGGKSRNTPHCLAVKRCWVGAHAGARHCTGKGGAQEVHVGSAAAGAKGGVHDHGVSAQAGARHRCHVTLQQVDLLRQPDQSVPSLPLSRLGKTASLSWVGHQGGLPHKSHMQKRCFGCEVARHQISLLAAA